MLITRDNADYLMLHEAFGNNTDIIHQDCCYHMLVYLNRNKTEIVHYSAFDDINDAKARYALSFEKLLAETIGMNTGLANLICSYYGLVDTYRLLEALNQPHTPHNHAFLDAICGYSNGFLVYKYQLVLLYRYLTECSLPDAEKFVRDWNKKLPYTRKIASEIMFEDKTLIDLLISKRLFTDFEFYINFREDFHIRLLQFLGL
jgi:hypothetical protein